jgi:hypothetical protein
MIIEKSFTILFFKPLLDFPLKFKNVAQCIQSVDKGAKLLKILYKSYAY